MNLYKIIGKAREKSKLKIIQDDEYRAEKDVLSGRYEVFFEYPSSSPIVVVLEDSRGGSVIFPYVEMVEVLEYK